MTSSAGGPLADRVQDSLLSNMNKQAEEVAKYANKAELSEQDLIKFQMVSSRYSMVSQMTTNLLKNLTDAEKNIAGRM
jgi:hypothetical protein